MTRLFRYALFICMCAVGVCGLMWSQPALADSCDAIGQNKAWNELFNRLNEAYDKGDYDAALQYSRDLEEICDLSPILNYTIAYIHKNKGDNEKYLFYLQKSTQNTERFMVDKNVLDRIWSDKYIAAHPDASPEAVEAYKATIEEQKSHIDSLNLALHDQNIKIESMQGNLGDSVSLYKKLLWTGTGIGIGGLAIAGVGAAIVVTMDGKSIKYIENDNPSGPHQYKNKATWMAGWGLIGGGAALTIAGAAIAGVFGYKYLHYNDKVENENVEITFAPSSASVTVVF